MGTSEKQGEFISGQEYFKKLTEASDITLLRNASLALESLSKKLHQMPDNEDKGTIAAAGICLEVLICRYGQHALMESLGRIMEKALTKAEEAEKAEESTSPFAN